MWKQKLKRGKTKQQKELFEGLSLQQHCWKFRCWAEFLDVWKKHFVYIQSVSLTLDRWFEWRETFFSCLCTIKRKRRGPLRSHKPSLRVQIVMGCSFLTVKTACMSLIDGFLQTSGKTLITQWGEASTLQSLVNFQMRLNALEKNTKTKWVKESRQGKNSTFSLFQILLR